MDILPATFRKGFGDSSRGDVDTVDGRNLARPGMQKKHVNSGICYLSPGAGFQPSTVCDRYQGRVFFFRGQMYVFEKKQKEP